MSADLSAPAPSGAEAAPQKICNTCGNNASKSCSKCREVFYCSVDCQRTDWSAHKKACGGGYVFKVMNRHAERSPRSGEDPGPPPNITGSSNDPRSRFVAYFDNEHGEQVLVFWDFEKSTHPYVLDGDFTWTKALPLKMDGNDFKDKERIQSIEFANTILVSIDKMMILNDMMQVAKKRYESWLEVGGETNVSLAGSATPDIPYRGAAKSRKAHILTVPDNIKKFLEVYPEAKEGGEPQAGTLPCIDAPNRLPEGDTWEFNDGTLALKSPVYGHNTLYFDSSEGVGQVVMEWNMKKSDTARIWANYRRWDDPIELGPEFHTKRDKNPYSLENEEATKKVMDHIVLEKHLLNVEDARLLTTVYILWNQYRNNMLAGPDSIYEDAAQILENRKANNSSN